MLGDGVSIIDLTLLLKAARDKNLALQVKILDGEWEDLGVTQVKKMLETVTSGGISSGNDIRLRLFQKSQNSVRP